MARTLPKKAPLDNVRAEKKQASECRKGPSVAGWARLHKTFLCNSRRQARVVTYNCNYRSRAWHGGGGLHGLPQVGPEPALDFDFKLPESFQKIK